MPDPFAVFLSSPTLLGVPYRWRFGVIKSLGFDGAEVLLTTSAIRWWNGGLGVMYSGLPQITFHRWWGGPELSARILEGLHAFPRSGVRLRDVLAQDFPFQVVLSTYTWEERTDVQHILIQPTCTSQDPENMMSFETMRQEISGYRLAFDPMHWLQYKHWPQAMPAEPQALLSATVEDFHSLQEQIDEIHIYDFIPSQKGGVLGCNLFPGDGVFPVRPFLKAVCDSGWRGRIVWEIHPIVILKNLWRPRWLERQLKNLPILTHEIFNE